MSITMSFFGSPRLRVKVGGLYVLKKLSIFAKRISGF